MWRFLLPMVLLAGFLAVGWYGLHTDQSLVPSPLIGKPAPALSLPSLEDPNELITNAVFKGHISLLNVWATWCFECHAEHPLLVKFSRTHEVPLYGLDYRDDREKALASLARNGNPYTKVAFDKDGLVAINWGVYGAPETYLIDASGTIRHKYIGPLTQQLITNDLMPRISKLRSEQ